MNDVETALRSDIASIVAYLPHLAGALVLFVIGWIIAWIAGRFVRALAARIGVDDASRRTGLEDDLRRVGIHAAVSVLLGRLAFAIVFAATLVQSVDALEFASLSSSLRAFLNFAPHLILAALILLAGPPLGELLSRAAMANLSRSGVLYHTLIGALLRSFVIVLVLFMALQQLTLDTSLFRDVLLIVLGAVAVAGAIAFGWGTRTVAENLMAARYVEENFTVGDRIGLDGVTGTIERVTAQSTTVQTEIGAAVIPNSLLARNVVRPHPPSPELPGEHEK